MNLADAGKTGWFKAVRSEVAGELIRANKNAFVLLFIIAARARWRGGFNAHGLAQGESFLGDHNAYAMSEREYRTAKKLLERHGFATFKATNKGTIATLANSAVFDIWHRQEDGQKDMLTTDDRRTGDEHPTTNEEGKKYKKGKRAPDNPAVPGSSDGPHPPKFAPLMPTMFRRELDALLKVAKTEWKRIEERPNLTERALKPEVADLVAVLTAEGKHDRAEEAKRRPDAWVRRLSPTGKVHRQAWREQIERIENALKGIA